MGARSYDPTTGQFTTNDPSGLGGGDTNIRRYAANDPVQYIDPSGLWYFDFNGTAGIPGLGISVGIQLGTDAAGNFGIYPYAGGGAGFQGAGLGASLTFAGLASVTPGWSNNASLILGIPAISGPYSGNPFHPITEGHPLNAIGLGLGVSSTVSRTFTWPSLIPTIRTSNLYAIVLGYNPPPPPPEIVCVPLKPSDTGYGFFSGSLGSTTMCSHSTGIPFIRSIPTR